VTLKKLPDLTDAEAMAARGRRSVLASARNEACEALRDACVACQSADFGDAQAPLKAIEAAERLQTIASLWSEL